MRWPTPVTFALLPTALVTAVQQQIVGAPRRAAQVAPQGLSPAPLHDLQDVLCSSQCLMCAGSFANINHLEAALVSHGVDVSSWGTGTAKSLKDLLAELERRECVLHFGPRGVRRWLNVVKVQVRRPEEEEVTRQTRFLMEARQILPDGRERRRGLPLSEKMFAMETPIAAAKRGLEEELGGAIGEQAALDPSSLTQWRETRESQSYPTLVSHYNLHQVDAVVDGLPSSTFSTFEHDTDARLVLSHVWEWKRGSAARASSQFRDLALVMSHQMGI